jgi:RNA polymerase sigma factor (sigma-70 family)
MNEEAELLGKFADEGSQEAFAEVVNRTIGLVYGAALRQTGGDAHLAQDVTQAVFLALACRAGELKRHAVLTGWLYTTTRFLASKAVRTQARWQRREKEATTMSILPTAAEPAWDELRPVIDEAMHELAEKDRTALLLRFFEGKSLAEVGVATGLAENSARMRVDRALEKLRERLARRGITSTAAAVGTLLASQPAVAVPAGLAASAAGTALAGAIAGSGLLAASGIGGAGANALAFMSTTKLATGAAVLIAVGALGGYLSAQYRADFPELAARPAESAALPPATARSKETASGTTAPPRAARNLTSANAPATGATASAPLDALRTLLDLERRKLAKSDVTLVSGGAQLTPQFIELFALTPDNQSALQQGLDAARQRMRELYRENLSTTLSPSGNEVTLELKSFPEAGGAVYDTLLKTFAATLGPERYNAFLALGAEQAEKELGRFGTAYATITVSRETATDGEVRYRIRSRQSETPENNSNYLSDRLTLERFRREAGEFAELLPPDFLPNR